MESVRAGRLYGTPPLGRQDSVDGLHIPSSSCSGSSSWVLWRDVGTPYCETRRRRGRLCSALLALAVLLVVLTVLAIASLAVYMGALRIDTSKSDLVFEGEMRVLSEEHFSPALWDNSSTTFRDRALRYQDMLEAVFHMSQLRSAMRYCSVERFENNGSSLLVFFRLHLDRRKIPRTLLNVEETAKEILVEEVTSLRPVSFRNVLVDSASIFIKRFLDDDGFQPIVLPKEQGESEETNHTVEVRKGVLLKAPSSTTEASLSPEVTELDEKNIPMVEGTYTVTKLEESKPKNRTPSSTTTEPLLVTHKTEHNVLTKRIGDLYNEPQTENVVKPAVGETSQPAVLRTNTYNDRYEHHGTADKSAYLESMGFPNEEWKPVVSSPTEEQTWRPHDTFDNLAARRRIMDNVTFSTLPPFVSEEPWRPIISGTGVAEVVPLPDDNEFMSRQHSTSAPLFNSEDDVAVSVGKEAFKPQHHERVPALEGLEDKLSTISLHVLGTGTAADSPDVSILHTSSSGGIIIKKHRNHTETTPVYYMTTPASSKVKATTPNPQTTIVPQLPLLKHFPQLDSIFTLHTQKKGDISEKHHINGSKEYWTHSKIIKQSEAVQLQKYIENNDKLDQSNIEKQSMSKIDTSSERKHSFNVEETKLNDRATASNQPAPLDEVTLIFKENSSSTTPLAKTKPDPAPTPFPLITLLPVKSYLGGPLRPRPKIPLVNNTSNQSSIPYTDNIMLTEQPVAAEVLEVVKKTSTSNSNESHLLEANSDHLLEPKNSSLKNENKDISSSILSSNSAYNNTENSSSANNSPLNNDYSTNSKNDNHHIPSNLSTTSYFIPNISSINNSNHQLQNHSFSPENDQNHHIISNISSPSEVQDHSRSGNSSVVSVQGTNSSESEQHSHSTTESSHFSENTTSSSQEVEDVISPTENPTANVTSTELNDAVWHAVTIVRNTPKGSTSSLSIENVTSTTESSIVLNTEVVTSTTMEVSYSKNLTGMLEVMPPPETNTSEMNIAMKPSHNNKTEENRNATVIEGTEEDLPRIHFQPAIPVPLLTKVKITQRNQTSVRNPVVSHRQPKMGASWLQDGINAADAKLILEEIFENLTTGAPSNLLASSTTEMNGLVALDTSLQSSTDGNMEVNRNFTTRAPSDRPASSTVETDRLISHDTSVQSSTNDYMEINMNFTISKVSTTYNISKKIDEYTLPPTSGTTYARDASTIFVDPMTTTESEGESFPVSTDFEDITTTLSPTTYKSEFTGNMEKSLTGGDNGTMVRVLNAISKFATIHTNSHSSSTKHSKDSHQRGNSTSNEGSTSNEIKNTSVRAEDKVPVSIPMFPLLTKIYNKIPVHKETNKTKNEVTSQAELNTTNSKECSGNYSLRCGNGECISAMSRCNQLVNCNDGADERDCSCADYLRAQFLTRKLCDGIVDCWDYSDENDCEWCSPGQFVCPNSQVCVDQQRLCDGARDCPYGDDEKQCVTVSETEVGAGDFPYHSHGFLMVRKQGRWGKLCVNNFETVIARSHATWEISDLGRAVCKAMTFSDFERVDRTTDPPDDGRSASSSYYELTYTASNINDTSPRSGLAFQPTTCPRREVIHVSCRDLECGVRPQAVNQWARIVGGGNAGPGSWPWQAALYKEGEFQCGATLVSQSWLVSAGHCFYHALDDYWVARLGALRRGTNFPSPYEQLRPIRKIILHPGYIDTGFINDISLLRLREPVAFSDYVRPICLPKSAAELRDSRLCTVVGWGQLFEVGRIFPDTLQEVQLPVISTNECRKRTLFLPLYRVTDNMFCAGFDRGGRDACLGDSGGPLMCQEPDGRWMLYGVTSNGYGCARANRPGVYTKVANYISWMETAMNQPETSSSVQANKTACRGHRCPLGECLPHSRVCNGFMECSDGSDERGCWEPKPQH